MEAIYTLENDRKFDYKKILQTKVLSCLVMETRDFLYNLGNTRYFVKLYDENRRYIFAIFDEENTSAILTTIAGDMLIKKFILNDKLYTRAENNTFITKEINLNDIIKELEKEEN